MIFDALQDNKAVLGSTSIGISLMCPISNLERIQQIRTITSPSIEYILTADEGMLQHYVPEIPEQAWDLMDLSDNEILLELENTKGIDPSLLIDNGSIFSIVKDSPELYNVMKRMRTPLWVRTLTDKKGNGLADVSQISSDFLSNTDYIVDLQPQKQKIRSYSVIKIRLNGEIKIVKK